jgi:hypothetical protein
MKAKLTISLLIAIFANQLEEAMGKDEVWVNQPHLEPEIHPDSLTAGSTVPWGSSGSQRNFETFRLMARPNASGFSLIATPAFNDYPPTTFLQRMYANFDSIEKISSVLGRVLRHPQVHGVRRSLLKGQATEIGGYRSVRVFHPPELRKIGLTFRPTDA